MDVTHSWQLNKLRKTNNADFTGIVVGADWVCTVTDEDGKENVFNGATPFSLSSVDPDNFVLWENLTEEIVLNWVQEVLNRSGIEDVQSRMQNQIDLNKNIIEDVSANSFPWLS